MPDNLPVGWNEVPASELFSFITSGSRGWAKYYAKDGAAFIRVQNVRRGRVDLDLTEIQHVRPPSGSEGIRTKLQSGDVLVTITADLGRIGLVADDIPEAYVNQHVALARPSCRDFAPYLAWFLTSPAAQAQLGLLDRGATRSGLGLADIGAVRVSLPPLAEQRRIVARIEALFGVIRDARKDLDRTLVLAERFRKRVLASAFENTDGWPVQPLGSVIARIEAGKNIRCVERQPHAGERGIVKISAVTWGTFDAREIKTAPVTADLNPATRIRNGDFLISRANTLELVGAPVIAEGVPPETYLSDKVLRLTFAEDIAEWVLWYLRSPQGRQEIESRSSGNQLSMRNIGQAALKEIPLPLPQSAERRRILAGVKASHAESHAAGHDARRGLALLEHLERAILDAAFRGDLVPQDAADEPVEETLARLRQEAEAPADPRGRQRRRAA